MTLSLAGLALSSWAAPWAAAEDEAAQLGLRPRLDLRSFFLAAAFLSALFLLAYVSNPGENSFRTYLTELSFRQHLSRLDDTSDDERAFVDDAFGKPDAAPVHFASRASVSLRTPRHVLHNCGILTIGAVLPDDKTRLPGGGAGLHGRTPTVEGVDLGALGTLAPSVGDSWYIGAFGKWWRGGVLDAWWLDSVARSAMLDTDAAARSGILGMTPLDRIEGLPFTQPASLPSRGRDRPLTLIGKTATRSLSPPPLPKSASLPLHTTPDRRTRPTPNSADKSSKSSTPPQPPKAPSGTSSVVKHDAHGSDNNSSNKVCSAAAAEAFASSPMIAELLRQIGVGKGAALDLRAQLSDAESAAAVSAAALRDELAEHRDRKRADEGARSELRTRTKALDDARRTAEAGKRDAERRLRTAQSEQDGADARAAKLDDDISGLRKRMDADRAAASQAQSDADAEVAEAAEQVVAKRDEIKQAEDVVATLNVRARELEEQIEQERQRLAEVKEAAEMHRQDPDFYSPQFDGEWDPHNLPEFEVTDGGDALNISPDLHSRGSSEDSSPRRRPRRLSLSGLASYDLPIASAQDPISIPSGKSTRFSPFGAPSDGLRVPPSLDNGQLSPMSSQLLSGSLIRSLALETPGSSHRLSFARSDDDPIVEFEARRRSSGSGSIEPPPQSASDWLLDTGSSLALASPPGLDENDDPFLVRPRHSLSRIPSGNHAGHAELLHRVRSDPSSHPSPINDEESALAPRRWFLSGKDKAVVKKGLNPDAKVFSLGRIGGAKTQPLNPTLISGPISAFPLGSAAAGFDMLNPSGTAAALSIPGLPSAPIVAPSFGTGRGGALGDFLSAFSMRAFAPSPAEREALQRALGGSTNTSLERIPSLAEVGQSLPGSPSHASAAPATSKSAASLPLLAFDTPAAGQPAPPPSLSQMKGAMATRSWLQSLPILNRKPKFSPWEDEDAEVVPAQRK